MFIIIHSYVEAPLLYSDNSVIDHSLLYSNYVRKYIYIFLIGINFYPFMSIKL